MATKLLCHNPFSLTYHTATVSRPKPSLIIVFHSLDIGGIQTKITDICQLLSPQYSIILALKNPTGQLLKKIPKSVIIKHPPLSSPLFFPLWLAKLFFSIKPKLILSFNNYCAISSVLAKIISFQKKSHLIISEDSSIIEQINSDSYPKIRKKLVQITYPLADKIITLTSIGKNKLLSLDSRLITKICLCPNWLPINFPHSSKLSLKTIDLLFLGRFDQAKNPLEFIRISHQLISSNPHLKIVMIGQGPMLSNIKQLIFQLKLSSKNFSLIPSNNRNYYYFQKSKIFLLSSIREGFPLTILEATASHCLPLCHSLSELKPYFNQHPELIFQNQNQAVTKINYFLNHPQTTAKLLDFYFQKSTQSQIFNLNITLKLIRRYLSV
jgi:glycosyltransferase involved in cell wall biosynthesis